MAILTIAFGSMIAFPLVPLGNQSPYYNAGSTIVLQIPIHAADGKIIGVTFHLPEGFRLYQLSPYQGNPQFFKWPDGTEVVAVNDTIPKGQSKTYVLQIGLPSVAGVYRLDIVWVYYGGRTDLLVDPNHTPAIACFFCDTPCRWGNSVKVPLVVRNMQAIPVIR